MATRTHHLTGYVLLGCTAPAVSARSDSQSRGGTHGFELWEQFGATADGATEAEGFDNLGQMAKSADVVVRGSVVKVGLGERIAGLRGANGAKPMPDLQYVVFTVQVAEVGKDAAVGVKDSKVTFELPAMLDSTQTASELLTRMQEAAPTGESVFFLRSKERLAKSVNAPAVDVSRMADRFRLVNTSGLVASASDGTTYLPMRAKAEGPAPDPISPEVRQKSLPEVAASAKSSGS